jgi:hypothetical protein
MTNATSINLYHSAQTYKSQVIFCLKHMPLLSTVLLHTNMYCCICKYGIPNKRRTSKNCASPSNFPLRSRKNTQEVLDSRKWTQHKFFSDVPSSCVRWPLLSMPLWMFINKQNSLKCVLCQGTCPWKQMHNYPWTCYCVLELHMVQIRSFWKVT